MWHRGLFLGCVRLFSLISHTTNDFLICLATPWPRNCPNVHNHSRKFSEKGYHGRHWNHSLLRNKYSDRASQFTWTQINSSRWTNYGPQMVKMTLVKSLLDKNLCFEELFRAEFLINTMLKTYRARKLVIAEKTSVGISESPVPSRYLKWQKNGNFNAFVIFTDIVCFFLFS